MKSCFRNYFLLLFLIFFTFSDAFSQGRRYRKTVDKFGIQFAAGIDWENRSLYKDHYNFEGGFYFNFPLSKKCSFIPNLIYSRSIDRLKDNYLLRGGKDHRFRRFTHSSKLKVPLQLKYVLNRRSTFYMIVGYSTGFQFGMRETLKYKESWTRSRDPFFVGIPPTLDSEDVHKPITLIQNTRFGRQKIIEQFEFAFGFKIKDLYIEPTIKYEKNYYTFHTPLELRIRYCMVKVRKKPRKKIKK